MTLKFASVIFLLYFCTKFQINPTYAMNTNRIPIGKLVADELKCQDKTVQWLAKNINTSLQNCYKMLHAESLNTDVLRILSIALNHNFFADYAALFELPQTPPPTLKPEPLPNLHDEFYALAEPYLKRYGYKGKMDGRWLTVWLGDPKINIFHWTHINYPDYEYVTLQYKLIDKRLKDMNYLGGVVLANELSLYTSHWKLAYLYDKKVILAQYHCCVYYPQELVDHLNISNALFCDLYEDFQEILPGILEDFPKD